MAATESATRATRALDELYRAHAGEVYRYAYAVLGNHADAEDVTQTTFVNALRALERGERVRKPSNWLITIAHNVVRQRFRQQQARPAEVELDHDVASREEQGDGPTLEELVQALQRIPHTQREAIVMRELEGRSYKEIAAVLELTPAALEALLFRARRSLAEELENAVTCERAELAISNRADGRLSRKDRRRLDEHLRDCPACTRLSASRSRQRRAFGALAVLPLPLSLTFFKGAPTASAAAGLPTIGAGTAAVTGGGAPAAAGGGLLAGGVALKAVAVVAAVTVAGAAGYEGVQAVRDRVAPPPAARTAPERAVATAPQPTRPADRKRPSPAPAAQAVPALQRASRDETAKEPGARMSAGETPSTASPTATAPGVAATPSAPPVEAPASEAQPVPQAQVAPAADGSGAAPATRTAPKAKAKPVKGPKKPKKVKARTLPPQAAAPARKAQEPQPPAGPAAEPADQPAGAGKAPGPTKGAEMSQSR